MNKAKGISFLSVVGLLAALVAAMLAFMLANKVSPAFMEHIEVNGRIIPMSASECSYKFDSALCSMPVDGILVMRDGTEYSISYSAESNAFTIDDKFGTYEFRK